MCAGMSDPRNIQMKGDGNSDSLSWMKATSMWHSKHTDHMIESNWRTSIYIHHYLISIHSFTIIQLKKKCTWHLNDNWVQHLFLPEAFEFALDRSICMQLKIWRCWWWCSSENDHWNPTCMFCWSNENGSLEQVFFDCLLVQLHSWLISWAACTSSDSYFEKEKGYESKEDIN